MGYDIATYTGKRVNLENPQPEDICIEDIAHALSNICRFTGQCSEFYSVAQHSVFVSAYVDPQYALPGLLHDAAEAYINDLSRPAKRFCSDYHDIELRLQIAIMVHFNLPFLMHREIRRYDDAFLFLEAKSLGLDTSWWEKPYDLLEINTTITPQHPESAEASFLQWFDVLKRRGDN